MVKKATVKNKVIKAVVLKSDLRVKLNMTCPACDAFIDVILPEIEINKCKDLYYFQCPKCMLHFSFKMSFLESDITLSK